MCHFRRQWLTGKGRFEHGSQLIPQFLPDAYMIWKSLEELIRLWWWWKLSVPPHWGTDSPGELYMHWCGASWTVCDLGPALFSHFSLAPLRGKMEPNGGLWAVLKLGSHVIYILLHCMQGLQVKSFCEVGFIQSPPKVHVPPSFTCILTAQCSVLSGLSWLLPGGI